MINVEITWEGQTYEVDIESVSPKEFRQIKSHLGLKAGAFLQSFSAIDELDADAIVAALWLAQKRSGNPSPQWFDDVPWLDLMKAVSNIATDQEGEPEVPKALS